ncbi:MAG: serine/threonine protein kinase [Rubrobacter sp.]|nr:serine/threonine protein kinase [Rubrobacter sp.]
MRRLDGRFVLEHQIGAGGMARVFLGRDEVLDRPVAIKILREGYEDSEVGARFRREGRTAARLSHPNIVQVYDAGEGEFEGREVSYIVMEYVSGGDLKMVVDEKGPLTEKELARIGADVASGLVRAHERGIVHRDIKPQNILIDDYGRSKLTDFGVARALDAATQTTRTGSYLGTASYSSPEQLRGEEIPPKSDVYSLGCTLYQAAVGEPPFSGGSLEVANQQLTRPPTPPRARGAALSEPFEELILACLAKDPADRPDVANLQERLLRLNTLASGAGPSRSPVGETARSLAEAAREVGAAGVAGISNTADAARTRSFGPVLRGSKDRVNPIVASDRTPVMPEQVFHHRAFRPRRGRRAALAVGSVGLLLLLGFGIVGMPASLLSSDAGKTEQATTDQPQKAAETSAPPQPAPPSAEDAQSAVYYMYVEESFQDPNKVWSYLSSRLQKEVGSPEQWAQQERMGTLTWVYFTQMPKADVSGDTARVDFTVREDRKGEASTYVTGTWECVNEGGEWKLDHLVKKT